jgi:hypothetical protein
VASRDHASLLREGVRSAAMTVAIAETSVFSADDPDQPEGWPSEAHAGCRALDVRGSTACREGSAEEQRQSDDDAKHLTVIRLRWRKRHPATLAWAMPGVTPERTANQD